MDSAENTVSPPNQKTSLWWDLLVGLIPLLAVLPMLIFEAAELWSREYMRFIPVTLVAVGLIVGIRWRQAVGTVNPYRRWTAIGLLGAAALLYAYGLWEFSPWLSHLSFVIVFSAWGLGRFGNLHWAIIAAWTALLATTMRLPGEGSQLVINGLQTFAAWSTTKALDALGIPCINNGLLIETRHVSLLADEICGGWFSFFAFLSFAIFLAIVQRRSAVVLAIVLISVPMWAVIGDFLRLLTVSLAYEYANRDMTVGWDYHLLAFGTSGLILFLIWMTGSLFTRLLEPLPAADAEFGPIFSGLNKAFCWPHPDPIELAEPEDDDEKKEFLRRKAKLAANNQPNWAPFDWQADSRAVWIVRLSSAFMLVCAFLPISQLASQGISGLNFGIPRLSVDDVAAYAGEESLPKELEGGWQRIGFDRIQRNPRSGFGEFGVAWSYARQDKRFETSINLPFLGWHDPVAQRELQGWRLEAEKVRAQDGWVWVEADLENELGGQAYLLYSLFTPDSQPYSQLPPRFNNTSIDAEQGNVVPTDDLDAPSDTQLTYQFQVFIESGEPLSRTDQDRLRTKFLELREIVRKL